MEFCLFQKWKSSKSGNYNYGKIKNLENRLRGNTYGIIEIKDSGCGIYEIDFD